MKKINALNAQILKIGILPRFDQSGLEVLNISSTTNDDQPVIRLGHFAEKIFVALLKKKFPGSTVMTNIQIIDNSRTLGELDVLLIQKERIEHIEFCYKIYLFDPHLSDKEFGCWIGPNRRDSLKHKVDKLLSKQLPLFWQSETKELLREEIKNFEILEKQQSVCFAGQLYVPLERFQKQEKFLYGIPDGFYIRKKELDQLEAMQWHIPSSKTDWLNSPTLSVEWLKTRAFVSNLKAYHEKDSNPLCWLKTPEDKLYKCFVVNWD